MNNHTNIPAAELEVFKKLPKLKVIFDVGARADSDYLELRPKAEIHLFEPNKEFFAELKINSKGKAKLNNYGLGDIKDEAIYNPGLQAFDKGEAWNLNGATCLLPPLQIETLDWYVKENNIDHIDFLKIDTEGYDYKVLIGGRSILPKTRFIQYEHWNNLEEFHDLLEPLFKLEYIGYRNVLCMNKKLVSWYTRNKLSKFIKENKYAELA